MDYLKFANQLLGEVIATKRTEAEVYINYGQSLSIDYSNRKLENLQSSVASGVGLRVFKNKKKGFSYTNQFSEKAIRDLINRAVSSLTYIPPDRFNSLPVPFKIQSRPGGTNLGTLYDKTIKNISLEEKTKVLKQMEKQALNSHKYINRVLRAAYGETKGESAIVNSSGINSRQRATVCSLGVEVIARDKREIQTGGESQVKHCYRQLNPREITRVACQRAVGMLGARKVRTQRMPVVLDNLAAINFLGMVAQNLCADMVQNHKSLFEHKKNKQIGSSLLTIIDDGMLPDGIATSEVDAEGVPSQRTVLIEKGVLRNFLYDTYTANKGRTKSTGNAVRSFVHPPTVGTTNFFLQPGTIRKQKLFAPVIEGLYITETMGMHTVNPISGDFSIGVAGRCIEKGKLTYPVHGVTLAGNLLDLLKDIDAVGDDLKFYGSSGSPTVRVKQAIISGK